MKLFFKAGKSANIALLFIRITLGSLFLLAGAKKVFNLREFIESVQSTGKMDDNLAFVLAFVLPFLELLFGALYIIGLFTPITSFFIAAMSISFLLVLGPGHEELPFSYNFVFLACAVGTLISGAGRISFDALLEKDKPVKNVPQVPVNKSHELPADDKSHQGENSVEEEVTLKPDTEESEKQKSS